MHKITRLSFLTAVTALALGAFSAQAAPETGKEAPAFTLTDSNGKTHSLADFKGKFVVLEWLNHQCPFVVKHYGSGNMQALQTKYTGQDVVWLSIVSSAEGKQGHLTPEQANAITTEKKAAPTAVLLDTDGKVGRAYDAKTTPHMFVINPEGVLVYQGAIDSNSSPNPETIKEATNYVTAALDAAKAGKPIEQATTKAYGCSVKY